MRKPTMTGTCRSKSLGRSWAIERARSIPSSTWRATLIALGVLAIMFTSGIPASAETPENSCGEINFHDGAFAVHISERNTSCREARRVASSSWSGRPGIHRRDGFRCQDVGGAEDFEATLCTKGDRQIYWDNIA